jgi:hypothetical protein
VWQQAELTASDTAAGANFGWSVALSGNTALVGADGVTVDGKSRVGAAYVYTRSGTLWSQQAELLDPDADTGDTFGSSVALLGDTALVGADGATVEGESAAGAAYVYTRSGTSWTLQQTLSEPGPTSADAFGSSVALLGDTALIGADGATVDGESGVGAAWVFTRSGTSWTLQTELTDPGPALGDDFGWSVALATDTALVGAPFNTVSGATGAGAAYLFTRSGANWSLPTELTDPDTRLGFGCAVALSGDTALVCADGRTVVPNNPHLGGAAYVFTRLGTTWPQQAELAGSDEQHEDDFGWSAALSGDTALIGAYGKDVDLHVRAGAAYVFARSGTSWSQQAEMYDPDAASDDPSQHDNLGSSVALSGNTALVGADGDKSYAGAAYVELLDGTPPVTTATGLQASASAAWQKTPAKITLSATDNTGGSGVAATYYTLDGGVRQTYTAPFTLSDGAHTVSYWSVDNAGNTETALTGYANIDTTSATTTATGLQSSAAAAWQKSPAKVTLSATDNTGGSGVAATYYTIDGGVRQTYTAPFTLSDGAHTVSYWSVDRAGNTETAHSGYAKIDTTSATTTATGLQASASAAWQKTSPKITLSATDNSGGSGVAHTYFTVDGGTQQTYAVPFYLIYDGAHTVSYWSVDKAGNTESAHSGYVKIDSKAPTAAAKAMALKAAKAKKGKTLKIKVTIGDPTPSCGSATLTLTLTTKKGKQLWHLVKTAEPTNKALVISRKLKKALTKGTYFIVCRATDAAGNLQATASRAKLKIT